MDYENFIYKKVKILQENRTYFYWYLIHKETRNGVHFHGCQYGQGYDCKGITPPWAMSEHGENRSRFTTQGFTTQGIEVHSKEPRHTEYKPLENYEVAADRDLGFINPDGSDDDYIWNTLHDWFESQFRNVEKPQPEDKDY